MVQLNNQIVMFIFIIVVEEKSNDGLHELQSLQMTLLL